MLLLFLLSSKTPGVTARGTADKFVTCEACDAEYVYAAEREAEGKGPAFSWSAAGAARRTAEDADRRLDRALADAVDVVPCPACGHVQQHMVAVARSKKFRWMYPLAGFLCVFAAPAMAVLMVLARDMPRPAGVAVSIAAALLIPGVWVVLHSLRLLAISVYDPNSVPRHKRLERGQKLASLRAEWEAAVRADREEQIARLSAAPRWGEPAPAGR